MAKINRRIDQSAHNHLRGQSIARAAIRHVIRIYHPIAKQRTANVTIVVAQDILQSIVRDVKAKIAGLRGQFTMIMEYNGPRAKVILLVLDTIKIATWGTNMIKALQLVIDGATGQINFVQPIDSTPPAPAVQLVQSMPVTSHRYVRDIARHFPKLMADGMGMFPDLEHCIMLMDDAIAIARPVREVRLTRHATVEKEVEQMVTDDIWE
uniref:Uncharacterized protein n=1 Tax=Romanomermis culicivorax TaxID=13658 RepID=A0A915HED4_ROMCU